MFLNVSCCQYFLLQVYPSWPRVAKEHFPVYVIDRCLISWRHANLTRVRYVKRVLARRQSVFQHSSRIPQSDGLDLIKLRPVSTADLYKRTLCYFCCRIAYFRCGAWVSADRHPRKNTSFVIDAEWHHLVLPCPFSRNAFVKQGRTYQDLLRGCMFSLLLNCLFDFLFARPIGYSMWFADLDV